MPIVFHGFVNIKSLHLHWLGRFSSQVRKITLKKISYASSILDFCSLLDIVISLENFGFFCMLLVNWIYWLYTSCNVLQCLGTWIVDLDLVNPSLNRRSLRTSLLSDRKKLRSTWVDIIFSCSLLYAFYYDPSNGKHLAVEF